MILAHCAPHPPSSPIKMERLRTVLGLVEMLPTSCNVAGDIYRPSRWSYVYLAPEGGSKAKDAQQISDLWIIVTALA